MSDAIDTLLVQYDRELDAYIRVRDSLRPVSLRLTAALDEYLRHQGDPELLVQARGLRELHARRRHAAVGALQEWQAARGSANALATLRPAMDAAQRERFNALIRRDEALSEEREEFRALTKRLRGLLLLFEEMVV
jgi:hypothetical protein